MGSAERVPHEPQHPAGLSAAPEMRFELTVRTSRKRFASGAAARGLFASGARLAAVDLRERRAGDSNPQGLAPDGFQDRCLTS